MRWWQLQENSELSRQGQEQGWDYGEQVLMQWKNPF